MKIAVFAGGIIYDSQKSLIYGIKDYALSNGCDVFVFTCGGDIYSVSDHNRGEFQIYSLPDIHDYDGIIVAPDTIQNEQVVVAIGELIKKAGIPSIAIDTPVDGAVCYRVDNEDALYKMTEHVIRVHNRHKLLYISGPKANHESVARAAGFLKCVRELRKTTDISYSIEYGDFWTDSGKKIMENHLKNQLPDGIICANDFMASGVMDVLLENNIRVPEDVVVTGFDNSYEAKFNLVRITSIEKPMYIVGYEACKALCTYQDRQPVDTSFPVKHIYSNSCGCVEQKEYDDNELKMQLSNEKYSNRRMAEMINLMTADLNEVDSIKAFVDKLKIYVREMGFPYFYLCLCDEAEDGEVVCRNGRYKYDSSYRTDYSDRIRAAIAYENGCFQAPETINREQLIPRHFNSHGNTMYVVVPIHFRLHCIGYCIVGNSDLPFETLQFESWIMNIGNSLENIHRHTIMKNMIAYLDRMWTYDTMTGVLNRAGFFIKADEVKKYCETMEQKILLIFIDTDKLKHVNDNYGHEEGDFYIKSVADCCMESCPDNGIVMRYGGDEFVILAPMASETMAQEIIAAVNTQMAKTHDDSRKPYPMSISAGAYTAWVNEDFCLEQLIDNADKEMYKIKHAR